MMPMDSASERYKSARRVLEEHGYADAKPGDPGSIAQLTLALRSLLKDPTEGYDVPTITQAAYDAWLKDPNPGHLFEHMVRAGIYAAWETWEPADRPDQDTMLNWLGIEYFRDTYPPEPGSWGGEADEPMIFIERQYITQEEA